MQPAHGDLSGTLLAGRFDILGVLGTGGMGAVYRAHDRHLDEMVALKVIRPELAAETRFVERFRQEVKLARRVTHPNVARTFELGNADGIMFCTMELVTGESLRKRLERGALRVEEAVRIAVALCGALEAAHAVEVIHRDIKPENILLAGSRVVLADFGVASLRFATTTDASGTPAYMAPEQVHGDGATVASDVYAVGVVLYEMLTGTRAFRSHGTDIAEAKQAIDALRIDRANVPAELGFVVARATARERTERIASAAELARALSPWHHEIEAPVLRSRPTKDARELRTIIVVVPRATDRDEKLHVAEGVHQALLMRLAEQPRVRVLPRVEAVDIPGAAIVELVAGDQLELRIREGDRAATFQLPLDVAHVELTVHLAATAIIETLGQLDGGASTEALDLLLRGRIASRRSFSTAAEAYPLLERAYELEPDNPRIASTLALLVARTSVIGQYRAGAFVRARELAARALAVAPNLPESHVAAGHLELHRGESSLAALHFRKAIACSPFAAEAHEVLGRMLLEAGFIEAGFARIEDALAISPVFTAARWEMARTYALLGDWEAYDRAAHQVPTIGDRLLGRARILWWRGDRRGIAELRKEVEELPTFAPEWLPAMYESIVEDRWHVHREHLVEHALTLTAESTRRIAFVCQLVAEAAALGGDGRSAIRLIARAVDVDLFDLHWLDRCPVLAVARTEPEYPHLHARVKRRAYAILDAMHGDHEAKELSNTVRF